MDVEVSACILTFITAGHKMATVLTGVIEIKATGTYKHGLCTATCGHLLAYYEHCDPWALFLIL